MKCCVFPCFQLISDITDDGKSYLSMAGGEKQMGGG